MMYIHFFPARNFLMSFSAGRRPVWTPSPVKPVRETAALLARHFRVPVRRDDPGSAGFSFVVSSLAGAPAALRQRLPAELAACDPACFICLLTDRKDPSVWIGGRDTRCLSAGRSFLKRMAPFLLEKHLVAADLHLHTTCSDGQLRPEDVYAAAVRAGLDAVAITDHGTTRGVGIVRGHSPRSFPVITGQEIKDSGDTHLLVYGEASFPDKISPEAALQLWRSGRRLVVQAHPTSRRYFTAERGRALGVEAFNFASSAPRAGRRYAARMLARGNRVPVLGCSDAHLAEDIGQARTYVHVPSVTASAVMRAVANGETAAFRRGTFAGDPSLCAALRYLYRHSNLLRPEFIPASIAGRRRQLPPAAGIPGRHLFCDGKKCDCRETWFRAEGRPGTLRLDFGRRKRALLRINGIALPVVLHPGMEFDLSPFLRRGANVVECADEEILAVFHPRICLGHEIAVWELKVGGGPWRPAHAGSNVQVLGLAPPHYRGEMLYRTRVNTDLFGAGIPSLFFDGLDGDIEIRVNGRTVRRRSNAHWWDGFEVALPPAFRAVKALDLQVYIGNERGFCGITNLVFAGSVLSLEKPRNIVELNGDRPGLLVMRCGEPRVRAFLCDRKGTVLHTVLAGSPLTPPRVHRTPGITWVVLNTFGDPLPDYQPYLTVRSDK